MILSLFFACSVSEPAYVGRNDIDKGIARGSHAELCAGLRQKDEETREYAASKIKDFAGDSSCVCDRAQVDGHWDAAVFKGLAHNKSDAIGCLGRLLDDPAQPERPALVKAMVATDSPALLTRVKQAAKDDTDPKVKAAAILAFAGTKDKAEIQFLMDGLANNPEATWRWSAAQALSGRGEASEALQAAAKGDKDAAVRAMALESLRSLRDAPFVALACDLLLHDPDPVVRARVPALLRNNRDPVALTCLRDRLFTFEPDGDARAALLQSIQTNGSGDAAKMLCDAIPFWTVTYITDAAPERDGNTDIVHAQNERDFEQSYACVERAFRGTRGLTCHGKQYLAGYYQELGAKVSVPRCPGDAPRAGAGGGAHEITF